MQKATNMIPPGPTRAAPVAYLVEVATRAKQNPGAVLLPADFKSAE